jgi:hypothetical protein
LELLTAAVMLLHPQGSAGAMHLCFTPPTVSHVLPCYLLPRFWPCSPLARSLLVSIGAINMHSCISPQSLSHIVPAVLFVTPFISCREPAGVQGCHQDCRLWPGQGDPLTTAIHRLRVNTLVSSNETEPAAFPFRACTWPAAAVCTDYAGKPYGAASAPWTAPAAFTARTCILHLSMTNW